MFERVEIKPFKKRALFRDEIRDYMIEAILSGQLKPGDHIIETRWAKDLGVSASPVREAIRELELIGLVENKPFHGSYVKELTIQDIKDIYTVRINLESLAVRQCIKTISENQLEDIFFELKAMETASENNQFDLFIKYDTLFHEKIVEASGNKMLISLWKQCSIRAMTLINTKLSHMGMIPLANRHEKIYNALKEKDEEKAVEAISAHFDELIDELENGKK